MRTTIEIRDDLRSRLVELAARRGEKGFSKIVEAAIEAYMSRESGREERLRSVLALQGSLSDGEAEEMRAAIRDSRRAWRTGGA